MVFVEDGAEAEAEEQKEQPWEVEGPLMFSSWVACCAPGTGAFDDGCSVGSRVFYR